MAKELNEIFLVYSFNIFQNTNSVEFINLVKSKFRWNVIFFSNLNIVKIRKIVQIDIIDAMDDI